ncbi:Crp/Fnr family transcriptional regulator [Haploplasma axanthum]|uniref:Anaerobic aromatic degradation regulator n=1 Tax=Haploplasma axanthum TaxID=29552 RepID=A0A449BDR8_HAPAX|nr:Crp/Fnr family transcriptional regulator [Haploplasma axanthum]VEU80575.1 Anaerobic aromatic degradation regulator [Haploplasma axanthum]
MINNLSILTKSKLFSGMSLTEINILIKSMNAAYIHYKKGDILINENEIVSDLGIILSGVAQSKKLNIYGKQTIVSMYYPGGYTALLTAISNNRKCPMSIYALEDINIISIPISNIFSYYPDHLSLHQRFLINLFDSVSERALELHDRNDCLTMPSVRDKILTFLNQLAKTTGSKILLLPFNREEMAEYLDVDRSALSRELSKMKSENIIDYYKNEFKILEINSEYTR